MGREIQERSYRFGRDVMRYALDCDSLSMIGRELLRQLFRSATSVGANLQEAQAAISRPDFIHKVGIARKEAFEARRAAAGVVALPAPRCILNSEDQRSEPELPLVGASS